MRYSDIKSDVEEVTGTCSPEVNYRATTKAISLLANSGLFDPLVGVLDFSISGSYFISLPRDVKTPIKININNNPAFARSRLFEFGMNTDGSVDGEESDWSWSDRGYSVIQNEDHLPGQVNALATNGDDDGKTVKIIGKDADGITRTESITMLAVDPVPSDTIFSSIEAVVKDETVYEVFLRVGTDNIAQYYPDEEEPKYRVIKLSKTGVACRMIYRKNTFKIVSDDDIIPLHSEMAVVMAVDAVRLYQTHNYEAAAAALATAQGFIKAEQATRDEHTTAAQDGQVTTAINANINTRDSIIVADIYDAACEIVGPVGRLKVFDAITDAVEALSNKSNWNSLLGWVDIWRTDAEDGYFVLPRFVEAPLAINFCGEPSFARNRWFEFHLNGPGERDTSRCGTWDDLGEVVTLARIPLDDDKKPIPKGLWAVPSSALDEDKEVRVFGYELDADGNEIRVRRDDEDGYLVPCQQGAVTPEAGAPEFVRIERITKQASTSFIKLYTLTSGATDLLLGYWYPDETEPKYRIIRVPHTQETRIRMRYRRRNNKITCLEEPIPLRSRRAIINMLRSIKSESSDLSAAVAFSEMAVQALSEEQAVNDSVAPYSLQFVDSVMPGVRDNFT